MRARIELSKRRILKSSSPPKKRNEAYMLKVKLYKLTCAVVVKFAKNHQKPCKNIAVDLKKVYHIQYSCEKL